MLDFTSALYLGLRHGSRSLAPWDQLTLGTPAALEELPAAIALGQRVAELVEGSGRCSRRRRCTRSGTCSG